MANQTDIIRSRAFSFKKPILIYTIAVGDEYWNMATLMVKSLRKFGKFDGEIRVYTERDSKMEGAETVLLKDLIALPRATFGKAFIGKALDCFKYERIACMDADVITIRDVAPIFELEGGRVVSEIIVDHPEYVKYYSLPDHPCPMDSWGLNTAFFSNDAATWNGMCQTWWDAIMDVQGWKLGDSAFGEQPVFNHLVRHGSIHVEALPLGVMHFQHTSCVDVNEHTAFIHARAPFKYETMRCLFGLMEQWNASRVTD